MARLPRASPGFDVKRTSRSLFTHTHLGIIVALCTRAWRSHSPLRLCVMYRLCLEASLCARLCATPRIRARIASARHSVSSSSLFVFDDKTRRLPWLASTHCVARTRTHTHTDNAVFRCSLPAFKSLILVQRKTEKPLRMKFFLKVCDPPMSDLCHKQRRQSVLRPPGAYMCQSCTLCIPYNA